MKAIRVFSGILVGVSALELSRDLIVYPLPLVVGMFASFCTVYALYYLMERKNGQ